MVIHERRMEFDDIHTPSNPGHSGNESDLANSVRTAGNLKGQEGLDMVRMFRRLVRGGGRQRAVGYWVF